MSDEPSNQSLNLNQAREELRKLYQRVAAEKARVEIRDGDGDSGCVLISREELDGLERALEMLSDTDAVRELTAGVTQLAHLVEPEHAGV
jgi:PHD/YefM family antitoxin component YafN of YafNO toxin-antitoxin module